MTELCDTAATVLIFSEILPTPVFDVSCEVVVNEELAELMLVG